MTCWCHDCIKAIVKNIISASLPYWQAKDWMDTPNSLLCGMTPNIYIEAGHGLKLIKMLKGQDDQ